MQQGMQQGMRVGMLVLASTLGLASASEPTSDYLHAERQYYAVISTSLRAGVCSLRGDAVLQAQKRLAETVGKLSATAGPRVLLFAVSANDVDSARRLLAAGAPRVGDQGTLLHVAARFGDAPLLEVLTNAGFGLEEHGEASGSPLFVAVESNRPENVAWLTRHGANANAVDSAGVPVLRHAMVCGNREVIRHLITAGARIDPRTRAFLDGQP